MVSARDLRSPPEPHRPAGAAVHLAYPDALRAVAILLVVAYHVSLSVRRVPSDTANPFDWLGIWGVGCFFVLSGYLLGRDFLRALLDPGMRFPSTRRFLQRRFLRIFPLYAVAVVVSAASLGGHHCGSLAADLAAHLTMLHGFFAAYVQSLSPPLWTMAVDAQFYVALPPFALALLVVCRGRSRPQRIVLVGAALAALAALGIVFRYVLLVRYPALASSVPLTTVVLRNVLGMSGGFALGMALALRDLVVPVRPRRALAAASLACGFLLMWHLTTARTIGGSAFSSATYDFEAALSAAAILAGLSAGGFRRLEAAARSSFVVWLASIAYAIYLFHWPIVRALDAWIPRLTHAAPGSPRFSILLVVAATCTIGAVAVLTHRFIERPFLTLKERARTSIAMAPAGPLT